MVFKVRQEVKRAELTAVITRADGTVEDLGVIAYHDKNKIRAWGVNFFIALKDLKKAIKSILKRS